MAYVEYISIVGQPEADSSVHTQAHAQLHTPTTSPEVNVMASPTI